MNLLGAAKSLSRRFDAILLQQPGVVGVSLLLSCVTLSSSISELVVGTVVLASSPVVQKVRYYVGAGGDSEYSTAAHSETSTGSVFSAPPVASRSSFFSPPEQNKGSLEPSFFT